jgi:ribonucleotide reductase beta subunit family protein with ferritin-like domain
LEGQLHPPELFQKLKKKKIVIMSLDNKENFIATSSEVLTLKKGVSAA